MALAAFRHHHAAIADRFDHRRITRPQFGGGLAQCREQVQAARVV
jgi:hypothetical protein